VSEFLNNPEEVKAAILGMLDKSFKDEYIRKKGEDIKSLVVFKYHDPDLVIWVDSRSGEAEFGAGDPADQPDVIFAVDSDDAHRVWSNKFNVIWGIARKKIIITGNATKILKLVPLLRRFAVNYNATLHEIGKESILLS
jgi:alkyl sulfatase BDS1-like metallo-beta-lactamase superfamily hydrolase